MNTSVPNEGARRVLGGTANQVKKASVEIRAPKRGIRMKKN